MIFQVFENVNITNNIFDYDHNPFHAIDFFLCPLKTENFMLSGGIETSDIKWVNIICRTLLSPHKNITGQKMKFSIKDIFRKYDHFCVKLRIWSHLLKKSLMKNFTFCAVYSVGKRK